MPLVRQKVEVSLAVSLVRQKVEVSLEAFLAAEATEVTLETLLPLTLGWLAHHQPREGSSWLKLETDKLSRDDLLQILRALST